MSRKSPTQEAVIHDTYKVCLSGVKDAGKTSIFRCVRSMVKGTTYNQSANNAPPGIDYLPYHLDSLGAQIMLYDTPMGMSEDSVMSLSNYYRSAACIVFVYDVTNMESLHGIYEEYKLLQKREYCPNAKYVILRNKIDLNFAMQVTKELETNFLNGYQSLAEHVYHIVETSAKNDTGIKEFFTEGLEQVLRNVAPQESVNQLRQLQNDTKTSKCC